MIERFKQHWLVSLLTMCGFVATSTWGISYQLLVVPRDFEIERMEKALEETRSQLAQAHASLASQPSEPASSPLVLPETGVFEGASVTTNDGVCVVRVLSVGAGIARLAVTIGKDKPIKFERAEIGQRLIAKGSTGTYFIDLHRERGGIIDLTVNKAL